MPRPCVSVGKLEAPGKKDSSKPRGKLQRLMNLSGDHAHMLIHPMNESMATAFFPISGWEISQIDPMYSGITMRVTLPSTFLTAAGSLILLSFLFGCSSGPPSNMGGRGMESANPDERATAIVHAAQREDRPAIPDLIEGLDSDDLAVRLFAIQTLEKMTGQRFGYEVNSLEVARSMAVERWVEAWNSGTISGDSDQIETTISKQD